MRAWVLSVASLLLSLAILIGSPSSHAADSEATLVLRDLAGEERSIRSERGRVVVVNFWATWCAPCREELPLLQRIAEEYADRSVVFVAASTDDVSTTERIPDVIDEAGVTFDVWTGATTLDMQRLDLGTALPATAIVDRDGSVAFRVAGLVSEPELRERLDWLLRSEGAPASAPAVDSPPRKDCCDHEAESLESPDASVGVAGQHDHDDHDHGHEHEHDHDHDHDLASGDASLVPS